MTLVAKGGYRAFESADPEEVARAMALRARLFPSDRAAPDPYDARCRHVLVEDRRGRVLCTFRLMPLAGGGEIGGSYAARFYGLDRLGAYDGPMVELGRFCVHPDEVNGDVLRVAWAALTRIVDREGARMLFGCVSFPGTDARTHADAFAMLHARHRAPLRWRPRVKAPRIVSLARALSRPFDAQRAAAGLPPLLRTYLGMGGWVSDHAVVDEEMGTMHVFTGVEVGAIPPARRRLLRAMAA